MSERDDVSSQIASSVKRIDETCMQGRGFDGLANLFHEDMVMVHPQFSARAAGRDACIKCYEDACSQMKFHKLDTSEQQIEIFGDAAVVSHKYDCVWDYRGKTFTDDGHEIFVFVRDGAGWKVAWRTLIPGSRQTEVCPVEQQQKSQKQDIRETCLDLIATLPICHLTTVDEQGYPHTTAMLNLRCAREYPGLVDLHAEEANDFCVYMTTSTQSPKTARLRANPRVCLYFCDEANIIGLMLGGDIEVVEDQTFKERIWQDGWTMYYPNGPQGPEYGVIRMAPRVAKGWCRNQPFEIHIAV
jgi:general stress protein 26/ketosteroid isomerase-like protein